MPEIDNIIDPNDSAARDIGQGHSNELDINAFNFADNSQIQAASGDDEHDLSDIFDQKNTANFINLDDESH